MQEKSIWEIDLSLTGIAKRDRKEKRHRWTIAEAHDDGTDAFKPHIGGLDIRTLALKVIEREMKRVNKAHIIACPVTIKDYGEGHVMQERMLFNPRQFAIELELPNEL